MKRCCWPVGGGDLEKHRFVQRDNIFKNKQELKDAAENGLYEAGAVTRLINATKSDMLVENDNIYHSKQNAFQALGLNGLTYNYAGQDLYKFIGTGAHLERRSLLRPRRLSTVVICCLPTCHHFRFILMFSFPSPNPLNGYKCYRQSSRHYCLHLWPGTSLVKRKS